MIFPFWKSDGKAVTEASLGEMEWACGRRSATLAKLSTIARNLGFSVPEFLVIPSCFAREINEQYGMVESERESSSYLALSEERVSAYQMLLEPHLPKMASVVQTLTSSNPILRGSSSLEGLNSLSFAGVCRTVVPQQNVVLEDYLRVGVAKVLAGSFTPYADYYMSHHNIDPRGRDVGLIVMKLLKTPFIHATAYVYPDELRIRYFLNPIVGSYYAGGHEMILRRGGIFRSELPAHAQNFLTTWRHIADVLWNLHDHFYGEPVPIDVELLMDRSDEKDTLFIVQMRPVSKPHERNYLQAKVLSGIFRQAKKDIVIPPSHLYHSVGEVANGLVIDLRDLSRFSNLKGLVEGISSPVFLVPHAGGEGTFGFLKALPRHLRRGAVLITHPKHRQHDHLQYSIYEDCRLEMVIHCDEHALSGITHGQAVALVSNGNTASIEIKE